MSNLPFEIQLDSFDEDTKSARAYSRDKVRIPLDGDIYSIGVRLTNPWIDSLASSIEYLQYLNLTEEDLADLES